MVSVMSETWKQDFCTALILLTAKLWSVVLHLQNYMMLVLPTAEGGVRSFKYTIRVMALPDWRRSKDEQIFIF